MAGRVPDKPKQDPVAWSRIGEAYLDRGSKIRRKKPSEALGRINDIYRASQNGASYAASEGLIGSDEKRQTMRALQKGPVGRLVTALNVMAFYVKNQTDARRVLRRAAKQEGISADQLLGPELPAYEIGRRLAEEVDRCVQRLKDAQNNLGKDAQLEITVKLASHAMSLLLREFRRLLILGQCEHCRQVMFTSSAHKRFCSEGCEGRDCGHRAAGKRFYEKLRVAQGRMTRAESARNAANVRWANKAHDPQK